MEIRSIVSQALESLNNVKEVLRKGIADLISEGALKWFLYSSYQNVLDALAAVLAELGLRKPPHYSGLVDPLIERGLLNESLSEEVKVIARSRNRLSHAYRRISKEELIRMADEALERVPRVAEALLTLIKERDIDPPVSLILTAAERVFKGSKVLAALMFGSRARGTAERESDYDIAILSQEPLKVEELEAMAYRLASELKVPPEAIDLLDLTGAPNELVYKVLRDLKPIYVADNDAFRKWVREAYIRVLDEESMLDIYFNRLAKKLRDRNQ